MIYHVWTAATLIVTLVVTGASCLKNVRLELIPEKVEHGHEVTLRCHYELEQAPLYSLKWYRGNHEFYRYSPSETPQTKILNFTWITVDPANSNESQVTILNVDFPLSGNFSCEVTTDAPNFTTASSSKVLTVVSVPKGKPVLITERRRYEPGEYLKANCSSPPSKPPAKLSFTLNDLPVGGETNYKQQQQQQYTDKKYDYNSISEHQQQLHQQQQQQQQSTELNLHLQPFHYINGQLNLRCTAKIDGIYEQTSELRLGTNLREPRPERVTSENGGEHCQRISNLLIAVLIVAQLNSR